MKYYLIAGEASGDLHSANLMKAVKELDRNAEFRFFGGDLMQAVGGTLVRHYREMAFMGFTDVLLNIRTISRNLSFCKQDILFWKPDVLILTDYAGFNLRIAEFAGKQGFTVFYYIAPKVWAWKKSRIEKLRKFTDRIYVIFPFEPEFFRQHGLDVEFHGNPLSDAIDSWKLQNPAPAHESGSLPIIALLPGSRKQEIRHCLPEMLEAVKDFSQFSIKVAAAPSIDPEFYREFLSPYRAELVQGNTYGLLQNAFAAVVTSGTATLETALFKVPMVVVYKTGKLTYAIGRLFVRIRFFSLVNLIAGREVVKELLQRRLAGKIRREMEQITSNEDYRRKMLTDFDEIETLTGVPGSSSRVAASMINRLKSQ